MNHKEREQHREKTSALTVLRTAGGLFAITVFAGLLGFGVIQSTMLDEARIVFFAAGTLFVAMLIVGLVKE